MSVLSIPDFVANWQRSTLSERSAAQQHFLGLCEILGQPTPAEVDQEGNAYTFEKGVTKTSGGDGFADVWMRGFFAWEYKGKHKDLKAAYQNCSNIAKIWITRRCLSFAILIVSKSTPTTRTRRNKSTPLN